MFNLFEKIKRWWNRVVSPKQIKDKFKIEPSISKEMERHLQIWHDMYKNKPMVDDDGNKIHSLNLAYTIANEKARLAMLEFKASVFDPNKKEDDAEKDVSINENTRSFYLDKEFKKVLLNFRNEITPGVAVGTCVIKAIPDLVDNSFYFDFVMGNEFFPISFNSKGKLTYAIFVEQIKKKENVYTKLEMHELKNGTITVTNEAYKAYSSSNNELGTKINLTEVAEWANLEPQISITSTNGIKLDRLLITMFTMPESNNIDIHSKLGMSCFEPARELINDANKIYSDMLWEFEGGALAIDAPRDTIKDKVETYMENGKQKTRITTIVPKRQKRLFREVNISSANGEDLFKHFSPPFRDISYINGINNILMKIEDNVCLARGTLSEIQSEARTATEIKMLKQRTYQSNHDLQQRLQGVFEDLIWTMDIYATLYNMAPKGDYKVKYEWDDSILVDVAEELNQKVALMAQGAIYPEEVAAWYNNTSLETRFKELATYKELQSKYAPQEEIPLDDQTNIE